MKVIHLLRKPCSEGTVAANVLRYGVGALNIDASRISTSDNLNGGAYSGGTRPTSAMGLEGVAGGTSSMLESGGGRLKPGDFVPPLGRWPANLILQHLPECEQTGTREEAGYSVNRFTDGAKPFGGGAGHPYESVTVPPSTVAVWACAEGCPITALDAQSGTSKSSGGRIGNAQGVYANQGRTGWGTGHTTGDPGFGDAGGASRYFKQFGG